MRKVAGLENELDVAKSTLYRYIDTDEVRQHVSMRDNLKYISDEGYKLLVKKFGIINPVANETENMSHELQKLSHETELRQLRIEMSFDLITGAFLPDKMTTVGLGSAVRRFFIEVSAT